MKTETNIVIFSLSSLEITSQFIQHLEKGNVKAAPFGGNSVRFVTHLDFTEEMLQQVISLLQNFEPH
jgi:threonine aldolase